MDAIVKDRLLKTADRFAQQGKFDSAIAEYRKVSLSDPDDLTVANTLGDLYLRQGRTREATQHFARVAERLAADGHHVRAIAMYKKIAKLEPDNVELQMRLGELYAQQKLLGEARQQYVIAAEALQRSGQHREALKVFRKTADLDPTNVKARVTLAQQYAAQNMAAEASEAFRAAGQECLRKGLLDEAVKHLQKALDLKPDSRPTLKSLAEAYATTGDVSKALDVIVRSLEADPNDIDLIIILGRTFLNAGMLEKAEATFEKLFKLDNSRYDYLLEVARGYVAQDKYDSAMLIVDRCIDLLLARRQKKKATGILKAILERDPKNVQALKRLAGIYKNVRERRNLINALTTLVQVSLAQHLRAEAVSALRQLIEIEPKKAAYQKQLESLGAEEVEADDVKALAVWAEPSDGRDESDSYGDYSYGDYSTELLEDMVSQHPEFLAARLRLLEDLVAQQPAYIEGRIKLKQLYLDGGHGSKAASQCLEIARHYEQQGDKDLARQHLLEAFSLNPSLKRPSGGDAAGEAASTGAAAATAPEPAPVARAIKLSDVLAIEEFEGRFESEWKRVASEPKPISIVKIVVDRFRTYEEEEGALKSLSCLEQIAGTLDAQLTKEGQVLASAGNEEFFAMLPETHPSTAGSIADSMRRAIEALDISHPLTDKVTVSLGVATAFPYRGHDPGQVVESVNTAVTKAQKNGGNRVVTAPLMGG
jgi:diguanylate cyclase (GGDEF)-like protein